MTRTICLRMSLHPRNLSNGDKATCIVCICDGFKRVSKAVCDRRVGVDAAHWRCGKILEGGLITEKKKKINWRNILWNPCFLCWQTIWWFTETLCFQWHLNNSCGFNLNLGKQLCYFHLWLNCTMKSAKISVSKSIYFSVLHKDSHAQLVHFQNFGIFPT